MPYRDGTGSAVPLERCWDHQRDVRAALERVTCVSPCAVEMAQLADSVVPMSGY
jgi:hypothetical protein